MTELTMDELLRQLGELSKVKENRDELRREIDRVRHLNAALQHISASWNTLVLMGAIEWISQNGTAFQLEVGGVEYFIRADVGTYQEGDVILVRGSIVQVGQGDIPSRVFVDPLDVQLISRPAASS